VLLSRSATPTRTSGRKSLADIWVGADEALFLLRSWQVAADTSLDDFEGHNCHLEWTLQVEQISPPWRSCSQAEMLILAAAPKLRSPCAI
jgi:hypothetical protein